MDNIIWKRFKKGYICVLSLFCTKLFDVYNMDFLSALHWFYRPQHPRITITIIVNKQYWLKEQLKVMCSQSPY